MELSTDNILSLFETDKQQRSSFALQVIQGLQDGTADPLKVHLQIKGMEEIIHMFTDRKKYPTTADTYQCLLLEAAEQHGKTFEYQNAKFSIKETGAQYSFSSCNDEIICNLHSQMEALKASIKERETFLKNLPKEGIDAITQFGEVVRIYPPAKYSTTSVIVSLK
jgi:hypothetical protein